MLLGQALFEYRDNKANNMRGVLWISGTLGPFVITIMLTPCTTPLLQESPLGVQSGTESSVVQFMSRLGLI